MALFTNCQEGVFSETGVPGYAAICMSIRLVLRAVASSSTGSTYLAGLESNVLPGWDAVGVLGQPGPSEELVFMQENEFPPNHSRKLKGHKQSRGFDTPALAGPTSSYLLAGQKLGSGKTTGVLKAGLDKSAPPAAKTGCARVLPVGLFGGLPLLCPVMPGDKPGGNCSLAISDALSFEHSELARGWMVAKAGAASTIMAAIIAATVTNKSRRLIQALSPFSAIHANTRLP